MPSPYLLRPQRSLEQAVIDQLMIAGAAAAPVRRQGSVSRKPIRIALVEGGAPLPALLRRELEVWCEITAFPDATDFLIQDFRADAVLLSLPYFARISGDARLPIRLSRSARLIVAADRRQLLANKHLLDLVDAWLLLDVSGERLVEQIMLALEGYALVPPEVLGDAGPDALRLPLLRILTHPELRVLAKLAEGFDSRSIATATALPEALVKTVVRSLLLKLHCRNRTEAGLFAHRQRPAIVAATDAKGHAP
jgi:two-component system nitrate/nitrite response regulator NarL